MSETRMSEKPGVFSAFHTDLEGGTQVLETPAEPVQGGAARPRGRQDRVKSPAGQAGPARVAQQDEYSVSDLCP